jgi:hypothetical protein
VRTQRRHKAEFFEAWDLLRGQYDRRNMYDNTDSIKVAVHFENVAQRTHQRVCALISVSSYDERHMMRGAETLDSPCSFARVDGEDATCRTSHSRKNARATRGTHNFVTKYFSSPTGMRSTRFP